MSTTIKRKTNESEIELTLNLQDGQSQQIESGLPFFDHMLHQLFYHGGFSIQLKAKGDLQVDDHHLVEDCGIVIGQALRKEIAGLGSMFRFADASIPLDESLSRSVIDLSGRPCLSFSAQFNRESINGFSTEMTREFFQALVNHSFITLHIANLYGVNDHHKVESMFKSFGVALRKALSGQPVMRAVPSTKGVL